MKLFGIEFFQNKQVPKNPISLDTVSTDSSVVINNSRNDPFASGFTASINSLNSDSVAKEEDELISEYRQLLQVPEVDQCVDEIVNEAIIFPNTGYAIQIDLSSISDTKYTDSIKKSIKEEFEYIYDLLLFNRRGHDIFKRWFVDSRINFFKNIDLENPEDGIQSVQFIDPRKIKKVTETKREVEKTTGRLVTNSYKEYFHYTDKLPSTKQNTNSSAISTTPNVSILTRDSVAYAPSGITDHTGKMVIGHLHNALRVANNLRLMEDSMLIYKLSRAPERRIFYIDTGNLPKEKAEQYVQSIANKYKTRTSYDLKTGKIKNDKAFLAITEDFWLARGGNGSGTQIDSLPGGQNSGDTSEVDYFKDKLYAALKVPKSRFEEPVGLFNGGTTITRDEVRFGRYIEKLRVSFSVLFSELLGTQLILKGILTVDDWNEIKNKITYVYEEGNYFKEQVRSEKLGQIANYIQVFDGYVGKYFSREYFYKTVCQMSEDEIAEMEAQLKKEQESDDNVKLVSLQTQQQIKEISDALTQQPSDTDQQEQNQTESYIDSTEVPMLSDETIHRNFI